jgi:hypothetical protein
MKSFLFGLGLGIGLGVLFAPMSGEQARDTIAERANDLANSARESNLYHIHTITTSRAIDSRTFSRFAINSECKIITIFTRVPSFIVGSFCLFNLL